MHPLGDDAHGHLGSDDGENAFVDGQWRRDDERTTLALGDSSFRRLRDLVSAALRSRADEAPPVGRVDAEPGGRVRLGELHRIARRAQRRRNLRTRAGRFALQANNRLVAVETLDRNAERNTKPNDDDRSHDDDRREDPPTHGRSSR